MQQGDPPPIRNTIGEGLAWPKVLVSPLRQPRRGKRIGKGEPVLVIPGLATGDISTLLMRRTLIERGFRARGWNLGINKGADTAKVRKLEARIAAQHARTGRKVILIGWSLGGLYARVLAQRIPQHVAMVVTVASPFSGDPRANIAWRFYEMINDHSVDNPPFSENFSKKPPVPTIAIWSAVDGVIRGECARGKSGEADYTMRVDAPHFALGTSYECIEKIIDAILIGHGMR